MILSATNLVTELVEALRDERVGHRGMHEDALDGRAALAGVLVGPAHRQRRGFIEIGVT